MQNNKYTVLDRRRQLTTKRHQTILKSAQIVLTPKSDGIKSIAKFTLPTEMLKQVQRSTPKMKFGKTEHGTISTIKNTSNFQNTVGNSTFQSLIKSNMTLSIPELSQTSKGSLTSRSAAKSQNNLLLPKINKYQAINPMIQRSFEVYSIRRESDALNGYGSAVGLGYLLTASVAITSSDVIIDQSSCLQQIARFLSDFSEAIYFNPYAFFVRNEDLGITVIALRYKKYENLTKDYNFTLQYNQSIVYPNSESSNKVITSIDSQTFTFQSFNQVLLGTPIFDDDWKYQGTLVNSSLASLTSTVARIDAIFRYLNQLRIDQRHPELDIFRRKNFRVVNTEQSIQIDTKQIKMLYWVDEENNSICRYTIHNKKWKILRFKNSQQFHNREGIDWNMNFDSRTIVINDYLYIIGGINKETEAPSDDFYRFSISKREIHRCERMSIPRTGAAVTFIDYCIYVIGGKYQYATAEMYNTVTQQWSPIAQLPRGRYQAIACSVHQGKYIFVIGGYPLELAGNTIDKYIVSSNFWESIKYKLPLRLVHSAIWATSDDKIVVIGGKDNTNVITIEHQESNAKGYTVKQDDDQLVINYMDYLIDEVITVCQVEYSSFDMKLYIINDMDEDYPEVIEYGTQVLEHNPTKTVILRDNESLPIHTNTKLGYFFT